VAESQCPPARKQGEMSCNRQLTIVRKRQDVSARPSMRKIPSIERPFRSKPTRSCVWLIKPARMEQMVESGKLGRHGAMIETPNVMFVDRKVHA
jgi:hypothetical protein